MSDEFIPPQPLNTAVLFLVFNRLDPTKKVFEAIREAKPPRLYIAADGARSDKEGEAEKVTAVRDFILKNINWKCEIKTLFRDGNLGCKYAVSGAIDWFFDNEEMGIILEDDCLPSQTFFWFCEELLDRYKDDARVGMISGDNFQKGEQRGGADYYFSIYSHIWGWASWNNRWEKYDVMLNNIKDSSFLDGLFEDKKVQKYWHNVFKKMKRQRIDTWDYQWTFTLWSDKKLTILPNINLIKNIGFGTDATHTTGESEFANLKAYELTLKTHPREVKRDLKADDLTGKNMFERKTLFDRIMNKVKGLVK